MPASPTRATSSSRSADGSVGSGHDFAVLGRQPRAVALRLAGGGRSRRRPAGEVHAGEQLLYGYAATSCRAARCSIVRHGWGWRTSASARCRWVVNTIRIRTSSGLTCRAINWATLYGSHLGDVDNLNEAFNFNNAIKYTSPDWNGFSLGGTYSLGGVAGDFAQRRGYSFAATYARLPVLDQRGLPEPA